jgi:HSP20 family protein
MLIKYRPFDLSTEMPRAFQAFEDMVSQFFGDANTARPWTPPVDIVETQDELVLKVDAPAIKPEDIEVSFENGTLTIKGKREFEKAEDNKGYHRIERSYGSFTRAFTLPESVDPEKLSADYKDGVLTITIGKKEVAKPRSVKVNVHAS